MHLAIWIITLLLVGLWTLLAWGLSSLLALDGSWLANLKPWLASMPFGGWLESWFPDWLQVAQALLGVMQSALSWLGTAAPVLVWGLWFAGALVLMLVAGALSLVVALIRKNSPPQQPPQPPPMAAA